MSGRFPLVALLVMALFSGYSSAPPSPRMLVERTSGQLAGVKDGLGTLREYCSSENVNPAAEDRYTAALPGALSSLLADSRSQSYTLDQIRAMFMEAAGGYTDVYFYPGQTDTFIASIRGFNCLRPAAYLLYVMNRRGDYWFIEQVANPPRFSHVAWAGDRWVVMYNRRAPVPYDQIGLWHIMNGANGWRIVADIPFDQQGRADMTLEDDYHRIRFRFSIFDPNPAPCEIDPALTEGSRDILYYVDEIFEWQNDTYAQTDAMVGGIKIIWGESLQDQRTLTLDVATLSCVNLGARARVGWSIREDIPLRPERYMPHADPCAPDFDAGLVDAYNDSLPRALALMLAEPEAQFLSNDNLKTAFSVGSRGVTPSIMAQGGDYVLAAFQEYHLICAPGSRQAFRYNLYVMNREGDYWQVGSVRSGGGGFFPFSNLEWIGNGWLAAISEEFCPSCYNLWEIELFDGNWKMEQVLEIEDQWHFAPRLTLLEMDQRIALDLQPRYLYTTPPCTFTPEIQEALYLSWQKIQRVYEWTETDTYEQVSERVMETHVLIDTPHEPGQPSYRELTDWENYCVD